MSHIVYPIKLNVLTKNTVTKILQKSYIVRLSYVSNAIKKILGKFRFTFVYEHAGAL